MSHTTKVYINGSAIFFPAHSLTKYMLPLKSMILQSSWECTDRGYKNCAKRKVGRPESEVVLIDK